MLTRGFFSFPPQDPTDGQKKELLKGIEAYEDDKGHQQYRITKVEVRQNSEFDAEFLEHVLPTLEWDALVASASTVGVTLPPALDDALRRDEAFLRALQHVLFDVHVIEGQLVCEESGQTFPIEEGRPNMMLDESLL